MIAGRAQAPMPMWGRSIPAAASCSSITTCSTAPASRPQGLGQCGTTSPASTSPAAALAAFERGQLGHHRGQLRPDPVGLGGQIGGQRPPGAAPGRGGHLLAVGVGLPQQLAVGHGPLQVEVERRAPR